MGQHIYCAICIYIKREVIIVAIHVGNLFLTAVYPNIIERYRNYICTLQEGRYVRKGHSISIRICLIVDIKLAAVFTGRLKGARQRHIRITCDIRDCRLYRFGTASPIVIS